MFAAASSLLLVLTLIGFYFEISARDEQRRINAWQLLTTKASGNSGKKEALEYLNSVGEPLNGINLSTTSHQIKSGVYLAGVNLSGAQLHQAQLQRANFSYADLSNTMLQEADLIHAGLLEANLSGSFLRRADLTEAILLGANLNSAYLVEANLTDAILHRSKLRGAILFGADLSKANLTNADLRKADFTADTDTLFDEKTCSKLENTINWESTLRDPELACGAPIPEPQKVD